HVNAGVIAIEAGELRVGDTVHIRGHTTDYYQRIDRLEVDHQPVPVARAGQSVGVHVTQRVREGDAVWKVSAGCGPRTARGSALGTALGLRHLGGLAHATRESLERPGLVAAGHLDLAVQLGAVLDRERRGLEVAVHARGLVQDDLARGEDVALDEPAHDD